MVEENGLLQLNLAGLGSEQIAEYSGIYTCNGSNGYSFETHNVKLTYSSGNGTTGGKCDAYMMNNEITMSNFVIFKLPILHATKGRFTQKGL